MKYKVGKAKMVCWCTGVRKIVVWCGVVWGELWCVQVW